ncbi:MAG: hypothetical protein OXG13_16785 [Gemmatimonadaceae bacterium]|nr:hypothetical protein [Gemmatimonadaceae bacterium]
MSTGASELRSAPARRSVLGRFLGAVLVFRLELRLPAIDAGLVLLSWLRRPVIQMPVDRARVPGVSLLSIAPSPATAARSRTLRRLDEIFPF